jgi:hypothetical protein
MRDRNAELPLEARIEFRNPRRRRDRRRRRHLRQ